MRKYTTLIEAGIKSSFAYRFKIITSLLFNVIYLYILFFIWKGIYSSHENIAGLTFKETYSYIAVSTVLTYLFNSRTDWRMSMRVLNGQIIGYYSKPLPIQLQFFFEAIGGVIVQFFIVLIPVIVFVSIIGTGFPDYQNIIFFILSLPLAFIINFCFEYSIGTISFYTESLWGVIILKNTVIAFLSGGLLPVRFFPENIQVLIKWLPFRGIIDIPINILNGRSLNYATLLWYIAMQTFWVVMLVWVSHSFYKKSEKVMIVNGG